MPNTDQQKEFENIIQSHSYAECAKFALFIIAKIQSIPSTAFDEWSDSPNFYSEDSDLKKDFLGAIDLLRQAEEKILFDASYNDSKHNLVQKTNGWPTSRKLSLAVDMIEELFPKLRCTPSVAFVSIPERVSHIKTDEQFFKHLPEYVRDEDAILLAKLLLEQESERCTSNEDYLAEKRMWREHQNSQVHSEEGGIECALCGAHPCMCSDPQHNS